MCVVARVRVEKKEITGVCVCSFLPESVFEKIRKTKRNFIRRRRRRRSNRIEKIFFKNVAREN